MSASRTEPPTPRRLREARRRGQVPVSRELSGAVALAAGLAATALFGPAVARGLARQLRVGLAAAVRPGTDPRAVALDALAAAAGGALPLCAAALVAGALAAAIQARGLFSAEAVSPKLERLDPSKGLRRLVSPTGLGNVALGLAKTLGALALAARGLSATAGALAGTPRLPPGPSILLVARMLLRLSLEIAATLLAFALLDLLLVRRRHRRALMMTRDEVRREQKEEEGDPRHRSERRRLHRALAAAGPVSRAAVVVVNPAHVAVALEHRHGSDDAPVVLAKAVGEGAGRLRALARRAGVPVVREVALARALYRLAEVGEEIPEELYQAAAVVLAHVHGLAPGEGRA